MVPLENNKKIRKISHIHKENPQGVPQSTLLSGSLTVEAALVFPLFLFGMVTILFFFRVLQVNQMTQEALIRTGSFLSLEAKEEASVLKAVGYFQKELWKEDIEDSYLVGGRAGIGWSGTHLDGDYVDLKIHYQCRLPVHIFGVGNIPIIQRVRMKKWTGYHGQAEEGESSQEQIVYITPKGTVYHLSEDCTHLRLSTKIMEKEKAVSSGYTPCHLCGKENGLPSSYYYVTEEGRRYHTRLSCSGLKRTVYVVRISEAGGRRVCGRCGGT